MCFSLSLHEISIFPLPCCSIHIIMGYSWMMMGTVFHILIPPSSEQNLWFSYYLERSEMLTCNVTALKCTSSVFCYISTTYICLLFLCADHYWLRRWNSQIMGYVIDFWNGGPLAIIKKFSVVTCSKQIILNYCC